MSTAGTYAVTILTDDGMNVIVDGNLLMVITPVPNSQSLIFRPLLP